MDFRKLAEDAARLGGQILQEWSTKFTAREKSPANLVTEADFASEEAIFGFLREHCPDHGYLGEEGKQAEGDSAYRWIVDPLDGTSNYVHRFPYYAVSVGLEKDGELVVGAIFDPTRDQIYSAEAGQGATCNGEPLGVSTNSLISDAMCMASLPVNTDRNHPAVRRFLDVLEVAQTVQRTGSAALNLCACAAGQIDAFWSTTLKPWDMAAGVVLVREAGGSVTKSNGEEFDVMEPDLLSSNGTELHQELIKQLNR